MHKKLIIDIGNTLQKLAVFEGKILMLKESLQGLSVESLKAFIKKYGPFHGIIQSSVVIHRAEMEEIFAAERKFMPLSFQTPLPFKILYHTPATLGNDRLAAIAGAFSLFPERNILVIDAGTCITYDIITASQEYLGGAISPGIRMRFKAMHTFTGKLPLIEANDFDGLIGQTTDESMQSGVFNGVTAEINETIRLYQEKFDDLLVMMTGGDYQFLHNKLKISIFAAPDLVLLGLNEIFDYNDQSG